MASKTISVTEEVYDLLSRLKLPHESFGDTIKRLCEEKTAKAVCNWAKGRPLWSNMPDSEFKEIQGNLDDTKRSFRIQEVELD